MNNSLKYLFFIFYSSVFLICIKSYGIKNTLADGSNCFNKSDAELDATRNAHKGDFRFLGMLGATLSIPSIEDGEFNSLVKLHGIRIIRRGTDYIINKHQFESNNAVGIYASKYNVIILKTVLQSPDKKTRTLLSQIKSEMRQFEYSDAVEDSLRAFNAGSARFLFVSGRGVLGVPDQGLNIILQDTGTRIIKSNALVLKSADKKIFNEVLVNYVAKYNRNLYSLKSKASRLPTATTHSTN